MVEKERARRLGTSILNQVVQEALAFKAPPRTRGGKRGRVYYCTQVASGRFSLSGYSVGFDSSSDYFFPW